MKDYLFLMGGRQWVSESEWEGGRQSETSKLILTEEQTVVPELELRLVHLSDALNEEASSPLCFSII